MKACPTPADRQREVAVHQNEIFRQLEEQVKVAQNVTKETVHSSVVGSEKVVHGQSVAGGTDNRYKSDQ